MTGAGSLASSQEAPILWIQTLPYPQLPKMRRPDPQGASAALVIWEVKHISPLENCRGKLWLALKRYIVTHGVQHIKLRRHECRKPNSKGQARKVTKVNGLMHCQTLRNLRAQKNQSRMGVSCFSFSPPEDSHKTLAVVALLTQADARLPSRWVKVCSTEAAAWTVSFQIVGSLTSH